MTRGSLTIRLLAISAFAPLILAGIGIALMLDWLPQVAGPIVVHWGLSGHSLGPASAYPILVLETVIPLIVLLSTILVGTVRLGTARAGIPTAQHKFMAVLPLWLSVFVSGSSAALLFFQRHSRLIDNPAPELVIACGAAFVVAAGGWFLLPPVTRRLAVSATADPPSPG